MKALTGLRQRRDEAVKEDVTWPLTVEEFAQAYDLGERDFRLADLRDADLRGANLEGASLYQANLPWARLFDANLQRAALTRANLESANLTGANLRWANMSEANLRWTNLRDAILEGANLSDANLFDANLRDADLRWANLERADLRWTDLAHTNFNNAILTGTCLDPAAPMPPTDLSAFEITPDGKLIGYRTSRSVHVKGHKYEPGQSYTATLFSMDTGTDCHPGLYVFPDVEEALELAVRHNTSVVVVHIDPSHVMRTVGGNYRCKAFTVVKEIPVN
jgi:uncharacterized protein YjbI with pentapeptide repeats